MSPHEGFLAGSQVEAVTAAGLVPLHLRDFSGPFDLLLSLINSRKLDITELALSEVTDEFIAYVRSMPQFNVDVASEFVLVAATLLDVKSARLLPGQELEDPDDIELLEARDLLFARLLQYRAYKQIAAHFAHSASQAALSQPRQVGIDAQFAAVLPPLVWTTTPAQLASLAAAALAPAQPAQVDIVHLHAPLVSVEEQIGYITGLLASQGQVSFRKLVAGLDRPQVVARFLALLQLLRAGTISCQQDAPLAEISISLAASPVA